MEYNQFGNKVIMRIDKGEEVLATVKHFCVEHKIRLASVSAIGAINKASVGIFNQDTREYHSKDFSGSMEIVSLMGTITQMQGEVYAHFHIVLTDSLFHAIGGHLNAAWVGATCELVLDLIDGQVDRKFSGEIGLNLFNFLK